MRRAARRIGRELLVLAVAGVLALGYLAWDTELFTKRPAWADAWRLAKLETTR